MTTASRSLATALSKARFASGLLPPSYTTSGDTTNVRGSVTDRPMPQVRPDEVLIKVGRSRESAEPTHTLLRLDEEGYTRYNGHSKYPIITGHEFAGEIVECGANVRSLKVGDLVSVGFHALVRRVRRLSHGHVQPVSESRESPA